MRRVYLVNYTPKNKKSVYIDRKSRFTIYLGNQRWLRYSTQKDCSFAIAEINRRLNDALFELNEMWIQSFAEYRRIWFYLTPLSNRSDETTIINLNQDIAKVMALLTERSSWQNGNEFSFKYFYLIIESLTEQYKVFSKLRRSRKQCLEGRIDETRICTLERIRESLETMTIETKYSPKSFEKLNPGGKKK